jgi:hypothetical protein
MAWIWPLGKRHMRVVAVKATFVITRKNLVITPNIPTIIGRQFR